MQHLTPADYVAMPWANGRGQTVELLRREDAAGRLLFRLSLASVIEDGPFSLLPGIKRNLTVISGPGFDLVGQTRLRADPLVPVAFAGDEPIAAQGVAAPCQDFNVMAGKGLAWPMVTVVRDGESVARTGASLWLFALAPAKVAGVEMGLHHLLIGQIDGCIHGGPVIAVQLDLSPKGGTGSGPDAGSAR